MSIEDARELALSKLFDEIDVNKTGDISIQEMRRSMEQVGLDTSKVPDILLHDIIKSFEKQGDAPSKLDYANFKTLFLSSPPTSSLLSDEFLRDVWRTQIEEQVQVRGREEGMS